MTETQDAFEATHPRTAFGSLDLHLGLLTRLCWKVFVPGLHLRCSLSYPYSYNAPLPFHIFNSFYYSWSNNTDIMSVISRNTLS